MNSRIRCGTVIIFDVSFQVLAWLHHVCEENIPVELVGCKHNMKQFMKSILFLLDAHHTLMIFHFIVNSFVSFDKSPAFSFTL